MLWNMGVRVEYIYPYGLHCGISFGFWHRWTGLSYALDC